MWLGWFFHPCRWRHSPSAVFHARILREGVFMFRDDAEFLETVARALGERATVSYANVVSASLVPTANEPPTATTPAATSGSSRSSLSQAPSERSSRISASRSNLHPSRPPGAKRLQPSLRAGASLLSGPPHPAVLRRGGTPWRVTDLPAAGEPAVNTSGSGSGFRSS